MTLSTTQEQILAIIPKLSGGIGFPSAILVVYFILQEHREGKGTAMTRALLSTIFYEGMNAFSWFLSTWAVPADSGFAYASGTVGSCTFQGFWLQLVIGGALSNCALAYYFYQVVVLQRSDEQVNRQEGGVLSAIFLFAFGTSVLMLFKTQFNQIGSICWIQGSPPACGNSVFITEENPVPCDRGDWAWLYGMGLFYGPLWLAIIAIFWMNFQIYFRIENTPQGSWFATQSLLYGLAFIVTWTPSTMWSIMQWKGTASVWLDVAAGIFEPLAAFWDLLIFLRIRPEARAQIARVVTCGLWGPQNEDNSKPETAPGAEQSVS